MRQTYTRQASSPPKDRHRHAPLSWNEIKSRALTFSRTWADAAHEDSQGKPFWIDFFEIFGITNKRVAMFEHTVKKLLPAEKAKPKRRLKAA